MNTRGDKRTFENEDSSSSHGTGRKQKRCYSPDRTDAVKCIRNAKMIMAQVKHKLSKYECEDIPTKTFIQYIREIISKLDTSARKKTTVGVFGRKGAGKSSLINAILGETDLLPAGTIYACTSVIIQVEANVTDSNYTAEIEFISKKKLTECSTVWIVSEMNRAGSDKETWELVSNSVADMADSGKCRSISFICTKTDDIYPQNYMRSSKLKDEDLQITPEDSQYVNKKKTACILHRNAKTKERVKKNFLQQDTIKKHFDFFSVFTVSSEEFTKDDPILEPEDTEIPKLKDHLRMYNNSHTNKMASHYITGALGILFLIHGYKKIDAAMIAERSRLFNDLNINLESALGSLQEHFDQICSSLEELLSKGAKESEEKCVETAEEVITPRNKDGRGFHRLLAALCRNDGVYRSRNGETDLNRDLANHMFKRITEAFSDFFPVQRKVTEKSLQANIDKFTIITEELITKYKNSTELSPMLEFLKMEEIKLKTELKQEIVEQKQEIYASLPESIKTTMLPAYRSADNEKGTGSIKKKQTILLDHVESSKSEMFQKAKTEMLKLMENTKDFTVQKIKSGLMEAMKYSYTEHTLPFIDISQEIEELKKLCAHVCN